jgi:type VI secretion system protein ImpC
MQAWLQNMDHELRRRRSRAFLGDDKAQKPLAAAEVKVEEIEGNPGYYSATFLLRPTISSKV